MTINDDVEILSRARHLARQENSTSIGLSYQDEDGNPVVHARTRWGINGLGEPYFDAAGAAPGEEARLTTDADGVLTVVGIGAPRARHRQLHLAESEAEQVTIDALPGDLAARSDTGAVYRYNGGTAGTIADWNEIVDSAALDDAITALDLAALESAVALKQDAATAATDAEVAAAISGLQAAATAATDAELAAAVDTINTALSARATTAELAAALGAYRNIIERGAPIDALSSDRVLQNDTSINASGTTAARGAFYFDPADFAISGRTTKIRVEAGWMVNDTAPGVTMNVALYRVTGISGGAAAHSITLAGAADATAASGVLAANGLSRAVSADITAPVAGFYVLVLDLSGAMAVGSSVQVRARVQLRHV